ncbi:hypothetical protein HGM15179_007819 [Zosterops borbonicus]|uniref:Uncharacterized protein n=1 Tax=Zosterops borbonicus TaxID=364589 RepID=A0A8K1LMR7_9PASS|nr:hypothetical protein HGM15179_007819 [Zosterops borbonicus]
MWKRKRCHVEWFITDILSNYQFSAPHALFPGELKIGWSIGMVGLGPESLFVQRTPDAFEVLLKVACLDLTCREEACACCLPNRKSAHLPKLGRLLLNSVWLASRTTTFKAANRKPAVLSDGDMERKG